MPSQTDVFTQMVRSHMADTPPTVAMETLCAAAIKQLADSKASCLLVRDDQQRLVGIITEQDVTRRFAVSPKPNAPVARIMSSPVQSISEHDPLYFAIGRMRKHGWRHMPVVNAAGRPVGQLYLHDALAIAGQQIVRQIDQLTHDKTIAGLTAVKQAQVTVAKQLFDDNVPVPDILGLISDVNMDIYRRVISLCLDRFKAEGRGTPPVPFTVIVMGSGGRGESSFGADQDNGFIVADYPDEDHTHIDAWFNGLAGKITDMLDQVGLPLCQGNVMATNPLWRKTASQWRHQLDLWSRKGSTAAIRLGDIFFDFQPVFGDLALAQGLRDFTTERFATAPSFLRAMYAFQSDHNTALGFLGRLKTEPDGPNKGRINLKYRANLPLVETLRLWALRYHINGTGTRDRLTALRDKGHLSEQEHEQLNEAFSLITRLMLMQQIMDFEAGGTPQSWIDPSILSDKIHDQLTDSMKAIEAIRGRTRMELTGDIF